MLFDNVLIASANLVHGVLALAWWVLAARIVLSWIQPRPSNDFVRTVVGTIYALTDPVLDRIRRLLPFLRVGMLDLTPIALFFAIGFLDQVVPTTLLRIAYG